MRRIWKSFIKINNVNVELVINKDAGTFYFIADDYIDFDMMAYIIFSNKHIRQLTDVNRSIGYIESYATDEFFVKDKEFVKNCEFVSEKQYILKMSEEGTRELGPISYVEWLKIIKVFDDNPDEDFVNTFEARKIAKRRFGFEYCEYKEL